MARKSDFLRENLLINDAVLESSHQAGVSKLVSCLSTCVFPDKASPGSARMIRCGPTLILLYRIYR